jgi:hypothetical protein
MSTVYHKYVGANASVPEPSQDKQESVRQRGERAKWDTAFRKERAEHERLKRIEREANLARMRGELISRDEAQRQAAFLLVTIKQRLLTLPARLSRELDVPDRHAAKLIIDEWIRECLVELSALPDKVTQTQYENFVAEQTEKRRKAVFGAPEAEKDALGASW